MTKERLLSIPREELERIASVNGLDAKGRLNRLDLIDMILEAAEEAKQERQEQNNLPIRGEEKKYDIINDEELDTPGFNKYPIPARYNETRITFMARDPNWAYAYWDIEEGQVKSLKSDPNFKELLLRVHDIELVDFDGGNSNSHFDIPIKWTDYSWYIYLPHQSCSYVLELAYMAGDKYHCLSRSNPIRTPRGFLGSAPADHSRAVLRLPEFVSLRNHSSSAAIPQRIISVVRE